MADDGEGVRGCHDDGGLLGNQREGWGGRLALHLHLHIA